MTSSPTLKRSLGLRDCLAIVAGSMIGTGIFLKTATMTQLLGSAHWVLFAWFVAGVLSFLGALTYAELGALFPESGGGYLYIKEAYGRWAGFMAGWVSFWILFPGSIAAYAVAASTFMHGLVPAPLLILFFAGVNALAVTFGGAVQSFLTGLKILSIAGLALAIFVLAETSAEVAPITTNAITFGVFGMATLSALWAYDGWEAIARIAGEVREPRRNVPLALLLGVFSVFGLYAVLNLAYFWALPLSEIVTANSGAHPEAAPIATKAAMSFLGDSGAKVLSVVFLISTVGAMNGCIMTSARVPFAMARDGLFFRALAKISPRTHVPVRAVWIQAFVAILLAATGTFDQLTNYVVFSAWIFYGITGYAVIIFRKRGLSAGGEFRVPGYPYVPLIFVALAGVLVVTTLIESPRDSLIGIGLILTGAPAYYFFRKQNPVR
jgi:APA family basic amino acid/polyamine antiporter